MLSLFLLLVYSLILSIVFSRPIFFEVRQPFSLIGFIIELASLIMAFVLVLRFYKKNGLSKALVFFLPLFLLAPVLEGDWIISGRFTFHQLNCYLWNTPLAIIFYYAGGYELYLLYKKIGKGFGNRLKAAGIHLLLDTLLTTPFAILLGFWTFRSTLLPYYPFIIPVVHIGEVGFGFLYILFQEWLLMTKKVKGAAKPLVSISVMFIALLVYSQLRFVFDWFI